jgi:replicative DNA helicase
MTAEPYETSDATDSRLQLSETTVLGALLIDNDCHELIEDLQPEDFYRSDNRFIFREIKAKILAGELADIATLFDDLSVKKPEEFERIGGIQFLTDAKDSVNTTRNIKVWADTIKTASKLRKMAVISADMHDLIRTGTKLETIAETVDKKMLEVLENTKQPETVALASAIAEAVDWEDLDQKHISTGLRDLDRMITGLVDSNLVVIAGRPSSGKSSLAMQIAEHIAQETPVLVFSLEMSRRELATRGLRYHTSVVGRSEAVRHLSNLQMFVNDKGGVTLNHVRSHCRKIQHLHGLGLVVVDYLQLMAGEGENRNQEIGSLSRGLKGIAKEFNVPVIALSQLSRKVEERMDKRPLMSDLRDSGEIEQDADLVLFVYREDMYQQGTDLTGIAEIICRKNRNGGTGDIQTRWKGEITRFLDYDGTKIEPVRNRKVADIRGKEPCF